jgi:uncharacterized membrane protein
MLGVLGILAAIAFALTGWSFFGISSAYYAVGGLVVGVLFIIVTMLVRQKRRPNA